MNPVTSPEEPHPAALDLSTATTSHTQGNFTVSSRKLPISKSGPIDDMSNRLGIPIPEMIFGDNLVSVRHNPTGWAIEFTAEAALDAVDKTGANMLQVAYAGEWSSSRERSSAHDIREVVKPYDWSYSTTYRGTEVEGQGSESESASAEASTTTTTTTTTTANGTTTKRKLIQVSPPPTSIINGNTSSSSSQLPPPSTNNSTPQIPLELLRRRDPILFFDEVVLFESELDDNGISVYSVKVRVMEQRMLLLARLYMRLDNVVARVRDTRVYVDFGRDEVIREYTAKEDSFANVKRVSVFFHFPPFSLSLSPSPPPSLHLSPYHPPPSSFKACFSFLVMKRKCICADDYELQGLLMSGLLPDAVTSALRDANQVAPLLRVVDQKVDYLSLST